MVAFIRFIFRLAGCSLLAAAMVAAIADGSKSIARSEISFLPLGSLWPTAMADIQHVVGSLFGSILEPEGVLSLAELTAHCPTSLACAFLGGLCLWIGWSRDGRKVSSYA